MPEPKALYEETNLLSNTSPGFEDDKVRQPVSKTPNISTIILSITTLVFGLQALYLSLQPAPACLAQIFKDGYSTEWGPTQESIEMQQVTYTSAFRYNATSKTYYREFDSGKPQYVGAPAREIDGAPLLAGQCLILDKEEAYQLDDPAPIMGYYLAEVEVMHSALSECHSQAVSPEYYAIHGKHRCLKSYDSCILTTALSSFGKNIQCAGDVTPVPLRPYGDPGKINLVGTPQVHTCRNWDSFRKWYSKWGEEHGAVAGGGT